MPIRSHQPAAATPELFAPEEFLGVALQRLKSAPAEQRGAIFTRPEVVDFMLNLVGYTEDKPLWKLRLLEPSFGGGEFLLKAVERLLASAQKSRASVAALGRAIHAVELHRDTCEQTKLLLFSLLEKHGMDATEARRLISEWVSNADFLLENYDEGFDFVVGNPPYVRQELIPSELLAEYRQRYSTLYDRADLYVPFMERSLGLLRESGQVGFICSDRWMKNRYGGPLRSLISSGFSLRYYVDMVGTEAFQSDVTAYPAITVIQRGRSETPPLLAHRPEVAGESLKQLHQLLTGPAQNYNGTVSVLATSPKGNEPWLLESDAQPSMELVRRLEACYPSLEDAGCNVGIGVATGADKIFIGPLDELDVEDSRKLPLVMTRDILEGTVKWRGLGVVNPFEEDGSLADPARYPRFANYISRHQETLMKRHCAQRANGSWYRTIDRITPSLARKPKLLVPDIKGEANIVLEGGELYPHHNLYFITSDEWPLEALQAILKSGIAHLFVRAYSTKMRGGCLRFQAQYLRRIRLPKWNDLSLSLRKTLSEKGKDRSALELRALAADVYQLRSDDLAHLES